MMNSQQKIRMAEVQYHQVKKKKKSSLFKQHLIQPTIQFPFISLISAIGAANTLNYEKAPKFGQRHLINSTNKCQTVLYSEFYSSQSLVFILQCHTEKNTFSFGSGSPQNFFMSVFYFVFFTLATVLWLAHHESKFKLSQIAGTFIPIMLHTHRKIEFLFRSSTLHMVENLDAKLFLGLPFRHLILPSSPV